MKQTIKTVMSLTAKGRRVTARASFAWGLVVLPVQENDRPDHDYMEEHAAACRALLAKLNRATGDGWAGDYVAGSTPCGLCWVNVASSAPRVLIPKEGAEWERAYTVKS